MYYIGTYIPDRDFALDASWARIELACNCGLTASRLCAQVQFGSMHLSLTDEMARVLAAVMGEHCEPVENTEVDT